MGRLVHRLCLPDDLDGLTLATSRARVSSDWFPPLPDGRRPSMPLTHVIYSNERLLLIVAEGRITQDERIEQVLACLCDPGYAECDSALLDVTHADSIPTPQELRELVEFISDHVRVVGPRTLAIVAENPITFQTARTFESLVSASPLPLDVKAFSDREAALRWLLNPPSAGG